MNILNYLWPDNLIGQCIVSALILLFLFWIKRLASLWQQLKAEHGKMIRCEDVQELVLVLRNRPVKDNKKQKKTDQSSSTDDPQLIFSNFCSSKNLKEDSPILRHIKAIFIAGWSESRLEVGELIKHTTNELFHENSFQRSLLATFIVIGLLGTLIGLSDSLAQLSPVLTEGGFSKSNIGLTESLSNLLSNLKTAFAPSIYGVFFTIIGVLLFGIYLSRVCSPLKVLLDRLTLTVWVPQIFPTISQRLEEQMHRSFEAATRVADFAENIHDKVSDFNKGLEAATGVLEPLASSTAKINQFADKFDSGVNKLTSFQQEIRVLYQQMVKESEKFHIGVQGSIDRSESFQKKALEILNGQGAQLQEIIKSLKSYEDAEDAYIASRKEIDNSFQETLKSSKKIFDDIDDRNRRLVEEIGKPQNEKLGEIENTLRVQLIAIRDGFNKFGTPIEQAAVKIRDLMETFDKRTSLLVGDLKREFEKKNENNENQVKTLTELSGQIVALLSQLSGNSQSQGERIQAMNINLENLTKNLIVFGEGIGLLSQAIKSSDRNIQTLEQITQQIQSAVKKLKSEDGAKRETSKGGLLSFFKRKG
jgi:methyl-accepting chemotaxis protein